jgi:hypothetical protein
VPGRTFSELCTSQRGVIEDLKVLRHLEQLVIT